MIRFLLPSLFFVLPIIVFCFQKNALALDLNYQLPANGMSLRYDIIWEGETVGNHDVLVSHTEGGRIKVKHKREVEVDVLFITAFSETHEATEIWDKDQGHIIKIEGHTVLNGEKHDLDGYRNNNGTFYFKHLGKEQIIDGNVATVDSYWSVAGVKHKNLIDVAQGKVIEHKEIPMPPDTEHDKIYHVESDKLKADIFYAGDFMDQAKLTQGENTVTYVLVKN